MIGLPALSNVVSTAQTVRQPYREAANWIYSHVNDIYSETTIVLSVGFEEDMIGWNEYYMTKQGRRDPINITYGFYFPEEEILQYDKLFVQTIMYDLDPNTQNFIDDNYNLIEQSMDYKIRVYQKK